MEDAQSILGTNIESGVLSPQQYIKSVKGAMMRDITIGKELKKMGRMDDFKRALKWAQIQVCFLFVGVSCPMIILGFEAAMLRG